MIEYILALPILASFFVTFFFLPSWIKKAQKAKLVGRDMNKFKETYVAEAGGINVLAGFVFGVLLYIAIKTFKFGGSDKVIEIFALLSVILIVSFIGIIDGILGWKIGLGRRLRMFLVFFAAIPLMVINTGEPTASFFGFILDLGIIYPLIIIPIGIIGASTTFNFLAGYNGLEARQGILILLALSIVTWFVGHTWITLILICMISSLCAFLIFNKNPAKVFPGDVLTYSVGALIAVSAILSSTERFAVFIFIPYILEVILKLRGKLKVESFALPKKDGSIDLKTEKIYGLEHLAIKILKKYKNKVFETDVVWLINAFQFLVIILAFIIFRESIF